MSMELYLHKPGYKIYLPDITVDTIIQEEHSGHESDVSACDRLPAMTENGIVSKCIICGDEQKG
jgi:hypothetical protein